MLSLDEMARQRNVSIFRSRALEVATIPVACTKHVDVGFYAKEKARLVNPLSYLTKVEIRPGLFAYGKQAPSLVQAIAADSELCSALDTLLKNYAWAIEWSDGLLHARVTLWKATIDGDSTGGERFLSTLETVAKHIGDIGNGRSQIVAHLSPLALGPTWLRSRAVFAGFAAGLAVAGLLFLVIRNIH